MALAFRLVVVDPDEVDDELVCDITELPTSLCARLYGRRSVSDAGLGAFRPTLTYKAERAGIRVSTIDRFFPSSQIHHGCGGRLTGGKLAKRLTCVICGTEVDRDENAAMNIRDWSCVQQLGR